MEIYVSKVSEIHFESGMHLHAYDIMPDLLSALRICGSSGDQWDNVDYVMSNYNITGDVEDCYVILYKYGTWSNEELSDHDMNLRRLVWLAGGDLLDNDEFNTE